MPHDQLLRFGAVRNPILAEATRLHRPFESEIDPTVEHHHGGRISVRMTERETALVDQHRANQSNRVQLSCEVGGGVDLVAIQIGLQHLLGGRQVGQHQDPEQCPRRRRHDQWLLRPPLGCVVDCRDERAEHHERRDRPQPAMIRRRESGRTELCEWEARGIRDAAAHRGESHAQPGAGDTMPGAKRHERRDGDAEEEHDEQR